jgi:transcriptional regulator with XRE-family HTH domain
MRILDMNHRKPFFLKEWRAYRDLTQQQLAERLGTSKGYVSDLERGKRRYNQDVLERLAEELRCEPADLLMRDPTDPSGIWSIWDQASAADRPRIVSVIRAMIGDKTGSGTK